MFTLKINTDNAAFDDDPMPEIARILKMLSRDLETMSRSSGPLYDDNGNVVGAWKNSKGGK